MAKNIGATLSIKDNGFTAALKKANTNLNLFKSHTTNATGKLSTLNTHTKTVGDSFASTAKKIAGMAAAYLSISTVTKGIKQCIELANVQSTAEKRLESTMMNVKGTTLDNVSAMKRYASQLQAVTSIGDEVTIQGASQLATFGLQSDTIKTLLPQLQNLAVSQYGVSVSGDQMQQVANLFGKAMSGNYGSLSRYGIILDDTTKKILANGTESEKAAALTEIFKNKFGDLAKEMANTPEGRITQMKNAWGDMQETIGAKLYPVLTKVLTYATQQIPKVQAVAETVMDKVTAGIDFLKDNALPPLISAFGTVKDYVVSAFNNIKNAINENSDKITGLGNSASGIGKVLKTAFELCKPALIWIKDTALPGLIGAFGTVLSVITGIANFFVSNWSLIAPIIAGITGAILAYKIAVIAINVVTKIWTAVQTVLNIVLTANPIGIIIVAIGALIAIAVAVWMNWDNICKWCMSAFGAVKDFFVSVGTAIGNFFVGLWNGIKDTAVSVWTGITGFLSGAWNTISSAVTSVFTGIGNTIKNVWNGIVNSIKGAINKIIGAINGMIRGAVSGINGLINGVNKVTGAVGIPAIPTFSAPQIPMLADGGIVRTPGSVIVGERGAEMLSLPKGAQVTPLNKTTNTNNNVFYITINADGKPVDTIVNELIPKLKLALSNL